MFAFKSIGKTGFQNKVINLGKSQVWVFNLTMYSLPEVYLIIRILNSQNKLLITSWLLI